jgi:hypothetical protein
MSARQPEAPLRPTLSAALRLQAALLLALVFAAGALSGLLVARSLGAMAEPAPAGADQVFFTAFTATFDLDADQRRKLRLILEDKAAKKRDWANDYVLMQMEPGDRQSLLDIDRKADRFIRHVLRPDQRALYDDMLAAGPAVGGAAR